MIGAICRDCGASQSGPRLQPDRCEVCASPRLLAHAELHDLAIAHIDCDAFYASVEKRERPELANKPVIVGGQKRGVVAACCYIARLKGVHSAMPMFQARKACPDAVVIPPDMELYRRVGGQIRELMLDVTPLVEPLSVDEAFLDLSGTERLHGGSPAQTLTRLITRIEDEIGVTASVGLSHNKFLAKLASDMDKPRGFQVIGRAETLALLAPMPVGAIWGVGKMLKAKLQRSGIKTIGQLAQIGEAELIKQYGVIGRRLAHLSKGLDTRAVNPHGNAKSVSAETTFSKNMKDAKALSSRLWPLCETVARRLKARDLAAKTVTLKLKTSGFQILTRSRSLAAPTQLAEVLFRQARQLLDKEADGRSFRLIGIGASGFAETESADMPDLLDRRVETYAKVENAMNAVREKFGAPAIKKGRSLL
ncbi:MAG: DNA polymerase IV [Rhodospirillaceae bacterium]|jgi:DNA polymerase IV|nr:DNA polymerase IV [Rhodospirillaceae bacterium]MBT4673423.1 DNA polymerase IV [Rhodospirillaceae bacterium]MBT4719592.1 DNA polymerase IV [Rhodospirillaceae bacterium]MBT4748298.1 DNA polymerase IV [Rhodospirillaceae bacterium]MBT6857212.1 DNA polymerase IV [Rhodospirillaceae bacterium]